MHTRIGAELFSGHFGLKMAWGDHFDGIALVEQQLCHLAGATADVEKPARGGWDQGEELIDITLLGHAELGDVGALPGFPKTVVQPWTVGKGFGDIDIKVQSFGLGIDLGHAASPSKMLLGSQQHAP